MSLRTKLLAAVVVLPGAILLVALLLFMRAESATPPEAVDELIHQVLNQQDRLQLKSYLLDEDKDGPFEAIYVVRSAGTAEEFPEVWTALGYCGDDGPEFPDVYDETERRRVLAAFGRAAHASPAWSIRRDYAAVKANVTGTRGQTLVVVLKLDTPRGGAQVVYMVMVVGIGLMMIFSIWLVSRLVIRPLDDLAKAADRIAGGDYRIQLEPHDDHDEFGRTVRALNRMAREIAEYQGHLEDRVLTALDRIKKAEQHLTIAQRLAATGKLASGLAHEINNPLGGMKNAVRALARGDLDEEKTALYLDLVADGLGRVEQTVKKFLSFTPRRVEPHATDLADVAKKSVALAMHRLDKKRVRVETTLPVPGHAIVFGDLNELQQVALNLVLNAADAIEEGTDGLIDVNVERRGGEVVLRVTDNGAGMSREAQDHCFDMFFTTKGVGEGSGMGLAVVHNIVTNHGGRIELVSAEGEGTTFEVFLPGEADGAEDAGLGAPGRAAKAPQAGEFRTPEAAEGAGKP